jgi:hypothetical protein
MHCRQDVTIRSLTITQTSSCEDEYQNIGTNQYLFTMCDTLYHTSSELSAFIHGTGPINQASIPSLVEKHIRLKHLNVGKTCGGHEA